MQVEQGSRFQVRAKGQRGRMGGGGEIMLKLCTLTFKTIPNPRTDFFIQKGFWSSLTI